MQQTLLHSVWHERGCTVWVSVFLFSLLCFAKFNFKSICSVLSSLSLSFFLFSSPSLSLSDVFLSSQAVFCLGFSPGADWPMWCSLLWEWTVVDTAPALSPFLSFSLTHSLSLSYCSGFCYLSATSGGEWNRSWFSCQHQALSLVNEGSWGTTVWTHHWNLLVVPNMVVHENGQWLLIQASEDFILVFKDILVYWHSSWLQFCLGTWEFWLSGKGMSARVECVYVRWHFECMYAVSFTGYSDHVLNICIFFWSWLVLI